jgi:DNA-directed RNA polymerase subunit omega
LAAIKYVQNARKPGKFEGIFVIARGRFSGILPRSIRDQMNAELCKKALEKVGNPNVLINIVSRRVRQMNLGGGGMGQPLTDAPANMGLADIALKEIIEEKVGYELPEETAAVRPTPKKRKKH